MSTRTVDDPADNPLIIPAATLAPHQGPGGSMTSVTLSEDDTTRELDGAPCRALGAVPERWDETEMPSEIDQPPTCDLGPPYRRAEC